MLLKQKQVNQEDFVSELCKKEIYVNKAVLNSIDDILSLDFFDVKQGKTTKKAQYGDQPVVVHSSLFDYELNQELLNALTQNKWFKDLFKDAVETGLLLSTNYDQQKQFTLYQQYDRKDACRLLNWPRDVSAPMYGYRVGDHDTPIFYYLSKR